MSYTYTYYHHRQFDGQLSFPLPMPSPTSCWYPQRQEVQSGYSYPDPEYALPLQIAQPHPPTCRDNPWQPPQQCQQPPQTYQHPPQPSSVSYPRPEPDPPDRPPMYTAAQHPYQPFQPSSPPYQPHYNGVDDMESVCMPCDPVRQDLEPNLSVAAVVSQLERLTADVEQLVSRMCENERLLGYPYGQSPGDPHAMTSLCRTASPLPAAATVTSLNLAPPAPPCSPSISGDEGELLDDDLLPPALISQSGDPDTSRSIKIEISEGVNSSLGKRIAKEKFHKFDDVSSNNEANPNDGDVARINQRPSNMETVKVNRSFGSLKQELETIMPQLEDERENRNDRNIQFSEVMNQINGISMELVSSTETIFVEIFVDESALSVKKLVELRVRTGKLVMKESTIFHPMELLKKREQRQIGVFDPGGYVIWYVVVPP